MSEFTHLDETGKLRMVEVGDKPVTMRRAAATCRILVGPKIFPRLLAGDLPKGDVWAAARLAGIMAAKNTFRYAIPCRSPGLKLTSHPTLRPRRWRFGRRLEPRRAPVWRWRPWWQPAWPP
jgi:molybdenum cofactor biosynthesis enzyme